mgnify:CR=1 FL=1
MKTNLEEFTELRKIYEENTKLCIDRKKYIDAGIGMTNFLQEIKSNKNFLRSIKEYPISDGFLEHAKILGKYLLDKNSSDSLIENQRKYFEAYMAQLGLAIKSGNKY